MFLQAVSHEAVYWNSNKLRGAAVSVSLSNIHASSVQAFGLICMKRAIASLGPRNGKSAGLSHCHRPVAQVVRAYA